MPGSRLISCEGKSLLCCPASVEQHYYQTFPSLHFFFLINVTYFFPLSSPHTINVHSVNNSLQFIFCGVFTKRLHKRPQPFCRNVTTVVLVEVIKCFEILCDKNNKIFSFMPFNSQFDILVTWPLSTSQNGRETKWMPEMERVAMRFATFSTLVFLIV